MVAPARVIVTGAAGMLGSDLVPALQAAGYEVLAFDRSDFDLTDREAVLSMPSCDIVINCAAYTAVDRAESEREACFAVNVSAPEYLVAYCQSTHAALVQISTDYVFDGKREGYDEDDAVSAINYYGETKAQAEQIVRTLPKHHIIRTSWLFGRNGENFVEKVRRICTEHKTMRVVDDQRGAPTYTKHLARAIVEILKMPHGTYHAPASGSCSWYEFALAITKEYGIDARITPIASSQFPTIAARPSCSILKNNKGPALPSWQEGLRAYARETS